eukprot:Colp12_sorted_trinity150504_noHs@12917
MDFERIKAEAATRIQPPKGKEADLTDPAILDAYAKVRDDHDETNWMLLGYGSEQHKLKVYGSGQGGFEEFQSKIPEEPVFGYFRYIFGDTARSKFIFFSYVPDNLNGLKKAKVLGHKPAVESFLKYFHIQMHILTLKDLTVTNLESKLKAAGGADYGVGKGGGTTGDQQFGNIKNQAKGFYKQTETQATIKSVTYTKGPLTTTPCDLSGRPTVAAATEARKNMSPSVVRKF